MECLSQIQSVHDRLTTCVYSDIRLLNKLLFESEGDKKNRARVLKFSGFTFGVETADFELKLDYIRRNFERTDLLKICILLGMNFKDENVDKLAETICENLVDINRLVSVEEEEDDDVEEEDDETNQVDALSKSANTSEKMPQFALTYRDVEDSIRTFNGDDGYPVGHWISDFEDMCDVMKWGELQKFIFAKKALRGLPKLFVQGEKNIKSWSQLKSALIDEFGQRINIAELHNMLFKRTMKSEETVYEYFLKMKELANRGQIENDALFQYVINGIRDEQANKTILYGAKTMVDFKEKIEVYNKMRGNIRKSVTHVNQEKADAVKSKATRSQGGTFPAKRCFNCGRVGHISSDCKSRDRGPKCFNCLQFGHKSFECKEERRRQPAIEGPTANVNTIQEGPSKMNKEVEINGTTVKMLIDTGSQINLIRKDVHGDIGSPDLQKSNLVIHGVGKTHINPIGCFESRIMVDDDNFCCNIYVVPDEAMTHRGIIGCELLNQAEVLINQEGIRIKRSKIREDVPIINPEVYKEDEVNVEMDVSRGLRSEISEEVLLIDAEIHQEGITEEPIEDITTKHETYEEENEKIAMVTTLKPIEAIVPAEKDDKYDYEDDDDENDAEEDDEDVAEDKDDAEAKDEEDYEEEDGNKYEDDENDAEDDDEEVAEHKDDAEDEDDYEEEDGNVYEDDKNVPKDDDGEDEEDAVGDDEDDDERKDVDKCEDNELHQIRYRSKKTTETEKKNSSYESEVQAIVNALKKFRVYLLGSKFKVVTDCSAFQKTMEKKDLATRVARWAMLLEEYDYKIEHRSGTRMKHVDSLSRYPVHVLEIDNILTRINDAQNMDNGLKAIKEILKEKPYDDYILKNDILYKVSEENELLVLPKSMQTEIIRDIHGDGHLSTKKTEQLVKREYYVSNLKMKVERCIANCVPCILFNRKKGKQEGYLHPLHKEGVPLHTYHVDHMGPLETTNKNYKHIFAVIDAFTKFVWLYPTKTTTAQEVITKLEQQKQLFGNPERIISDRGTAFTAQEFNNYCTEEGIKHFNVTTGLPRANGQIERVNSAIIPVLSKMSMDQPTKWYQNVGRVQQVLNSSYHRSIGTTPIELMIGVKMKSRGDQKIRTLLEEEIVKSFEKDREELREEAKAQIQKVQAENRRTYNLRRRKPQEYDVKDLVAVKRTQFGPGLKLKSKFLGPYRIVKVKQNGTYDVSKEGSHEGPNHTTTCAEYLKKWVNNESSSEADDTQDGRVVGSVSVPMVRGSGVTDGGRQEEKGGVEKKRGCELTFVV